MIQELEDLVKKQKTQEGLSLAIGTELLVRINGIERKQTSSLVAFEENSFVAIRINRLMEVVSKLFSGNQVDVHYLHDGQVVGFQSQILGHIVRPYPLLFLTYPSFFSRRDLRSGPRVNCCVPATLFIQDKSWAGLLLNISTGGCRFVFRSDMEARAPRVLVGDELGISFTLSKELGSIRTQITIRNKSKIENINVMGARFLTMDEEAYATIDLFVQTAMSHLIELVQSLDDGTM